MGNRRLYMKTKNSMYFIYILSMKVKWKDTNRQVTNKRQRNKM